MNTETKELLARLKGLYEECRKSPPEIEARKMVETPWIFLGKLYDAFPALLAFIESQEREVMELKLLVKHAWIHSSYRDCGRDQMTTEQKALYDSIASTDIELLTKTGGEAA